MADEEHLEILREGVETWNEWREETSATPDLHGADLRKTDLSGVDLRRAVLYEANLASANLRGADLRGADLFEADLNHYKSTEDHLRGAILYGADLSKAELRGTNLYRVDLSRADLSEANLSFADLSKADLSEADLIGAYLPEANLSFTDLSEADLSRAIVGGTTFFQSNLKGTKGLDTVIHQSASNLDHFTIAQSDPLPLSFLRGCGLPDLIIDNIETLRGDPFEFYSCFISHSSNDQDFADQLYADLQDEGVRCWYAPQNLRGGEKTHRQIEEAIRHHDKLVLILSEASMESNWVEHEIREARERERKEDRQVLFPISLVSYSELQDWTLFDADEGRDLAREVREYYIPDFSNWKDHDEYSAAFDKLFRGLKEKS